MVTVEICVETPDGAEAAARGGADRIEVCSALSEGGVTPSHGLLVAARRAFVREVSVLIRPRGGDFVYSRRERDAMLRDIDEAGAAGADGVTLGALRADGTIDYEATAAFVERAGAMAVTFHRALDVCTEPIDAIDLLATLKVRSVLSSGAAPSAVEGVAVLKRQVSRAGGRMIVQAAGGVRAGNARALVQATGVTGVHASARTPVESPQHYADEAAARRFGDDARVRLTTAATEVRSLVSAVAAEELGQPSSDGASAGASAESSPPSV